MNNFEDVVINLNHFSQDWGPFAFAMPAATAVSSNDGLLPYNTTLDTVTVRAFLGEITPGTDLATLTEITATCISSSSPPVVQSNAVLVCLNYPGTACSGKKVTLLFEAVLNSGAKQAFFFPTVAVN